ncbi:hypothetical protein [Pseudomonas sp. 2FG]|uniref:hypothetical protein n=1 Tax=Pseudomonas sp. 2FG TaxID=2502191 RepID=UPI0010F58C3A|nr:hypothetical protein [Pseudomonas sp. 2FG]
MLFKERESVFILFILMFLLLPYQAVSNEISGESGEENIQREFIESKTGFTGWRYQGECVGGSAGAGYYKLTYYSPPKRKDVGGYGILTTTYKSAEKTYFGYELYPFSGADGCGFMQASESGSLLVFDTENWALSKRYLVFIDLSNNKKLEFTYSLKDSKAIVSRLGNGSYLIFGFGLCPVSGVNSWVEDMFCKGVTADAYIRAETALGNAIGMKVVPEIPGIGKGAFNYYVISSGQKEVDRNEVNGILSAYLDTLVDKISMLRNSDSKQDYYNGLLAIDSVRLVSPDLWKKQEIKYFPGKDAEFIGQVFKNYWGIIFNNRTSR